MILKKQSVDDKKHAKLSSRQIVKVNIPLIDILYWIISSLLKKIIKNIAVLIKLTIRTIHTIIGSVSLEH